MTRRTTQRRQGSIQRNTIAKATLAVTVLFAGALAGCSGADQDTGPSAQNLGRTSQSTHVGGAIIANGTVQLGVARFGNLNIGGGTLSSGTSPTTVVGLRYIPTRGEATAPGCLCEGWGVGDVGTGQAGFAGHDVGGFSNLAVNSFVSTASTATSVVTAFGRLEVTHEFRPAAATPHLYEVNVTIRNISGTAVTDLRYTRGMDWDIGPNTFSEYVTIQGTRLGTALQAANIRWAGDNGFLSVNPFAPRSPILPGAIGDFVDRGPADHGAHFDFTFGPLAPGATREFTIYYGAAGTEPAALAALGNVGAEIYSFGQANWNGSGNPLDNAADPGGTFGATTGAPHTFIFGFKGVGGVPLETCGDGVDNDRDGLIDNADPDCQVCGDGDVDPGEECDDRNNLDGDGCSSTCRFENRPPVAVCQNVTVCGEATTCTAAANIDNGSSDPDGGTLTYSQAPAGPYSLGTTAVTLTVSDGRATATCSGNVTVNDCTPPVITCPAAATAECGGATTEVAHGAATATDACGAATVAGPASGSYPLGTTTISFTATDGAGLTSTCSSTVTVQDTAGPTITPIASPITLWPPHHDLHTYNLSDCVTSVTDACAGALDVNAAGAIVSISSDEVEDARGGGDGATRGDIVIESNSRFQVRAERLGSSNGRVYTVTYRVTDPNGQSSTATCQVAVPHDDSGAPAQDDGAAAGYTVTP